ncbi:hypothetical protein QUF74_08185 [Candidatus Halobeggiatoa sp. HSG11]|nr:hypothetical protein [Candidatus Halobeggiatoa sp. HSG11]
MKNIKQFKDLETDTITKLSHLGLIKITGTDAKQFLQGQFTNDITKVDAEHNQLSAWCNHKGRIIVSLRIFQREEAFYLLLPQESLAPTLKRLQMFVLRSAVKLENASDNLTCIGISGNNSQKIVADCLFNPPTTIDSSITKGTTTILKIAGTIPRYIIISDTMPDCHQVISSVNSKIWQLLDIFAGLPTIGLATTEEFVPQMVNYQQINGISLSKGCYTGQEVVARVHYLGKLKRKLYLANIDTCEIPQPGDDVQVDDEKVGKIVNVVQHSEGNVIVLASIIIKHAESDNIHWQTNLLQLMELTYD